jgi:hypothetical protein
LIRKIEIYLLSQQVPLSRSNKIKIGNKMIILIIIAKDN